MANTRSQFNASDRPRRQPTWNQIADLLQNIYRALQADWNIQPPPFDTLPSEVLDVAVSAWCMVLSKDPSQPLAAPPEVQPWVLARLASMAVQARINAETGGIPAPKLSPETMQQLLISEWHGALRDRWNLMMSLDDEQSS
jgi:hypothetical protein